MDDLLYNPEAEQGVLASAVMNKAALLDAVGQLKRDDFYLDDNRVVFDALVKCHRSGVDVDIITLKSVIQTIKKEFDFDVIVNLVRSLATSAHVQNYIDIVRDCSGRRKALFLGTQINDVVKNGMSTIDDIVSVIRSGMVDLQGDNSMFHSAEIFDDPVEWDDVSHILKTGYKAIDQLLGGFYNYQLIILAARPGLGKSALALQIARYIALSKYVPMYCLEMPADETKERMLSAESGVPYDRIRQRLCIPAEQEKVEEARKRLRGQTEKLLIMDDPRVNLWRIVNSVEAMAYRYDVGMFVVDYLGLVPVPGIKSEYEALSQSSLELKQLAMRLRIPGLVVHQLNRYGEKDNLVPMLHHLRGSGQIEANADVVIFLHKDKLETGGSTYYQYELIIAKNRGGQTDSIVVTFDAPYMRFA